MVGYLRCGIVLVSTVLAACPGPASNDCPGGGVCPPGTECKMFGSAEVCGPLCGNGIVEAPEACDDGNTFNGDLCSSDCRSVTACGNEYKDLTEECDEGRLQSHDGCSSRCLLEAPSLIEMDTAPDGRTAHAIAYDAARSVTILFGGRGPDKLPLGDTWEWNGALWRRRNPGNVPPARANHAMAYDAARQRIVMFGGDGPQSNHTWIWNGANWFEKTPLLAPPQLSGHAMTYDGFQRQVVLFGGMLDGTPQNKTWWWNGTTWRRFTYATTPPARAWPAMAYDSKRDRVVLFGGLGNGSQLLNDTWEFDGITWVQRSTAPSFTPAARSHAGMTFDAVRGKIVMVGGNAASGPMADRPLADTWEWDGMRWSPATAAPNARSSPAIAYDVVHGKVVLFGGLSHEEPTSLLNDTWQWDGDAWTQAPPRPSARQDHRLIYDALHREVVLFGDDTSIAEQVLEPQNDMWSWNGTNWAQHTSASSPPRRRGFAMTTGAASMLMFGGRDSRGDALGDTWQFDTEWSQQMTAIAPSPRWAHAMAYDVSRGEVVMFGGASRDRELSDTWEWNDFTWAERSPTTVPPLRSGHAMAYDARRQRVMMFGGLDNSGHLGDTWEWDGSDWSDRTPATGPRPRTSHAMAYDAARSRLVLFGGSGGSTGLELFDDTWEWNGTTWEQRTPVTVPPARASHGMAYDAQRGRVILFGGLRWDGIASLPARVMDDVWEWDGTDWHNAMASRVVFRYQNPATPEEGCFTGFDGDGDGAIGCADPDCGEFCASCGNHVCEAPENYRLCPSDCRPPSVCGDFVCDPDEDNQGCPGDCSTLSVCGDFVCDPDENNQVCPGDCRPPVCGDRVCDQEEETCSTCAVDCGKCP